jgi:hypothetical protein
VIHALPAAVCLKKTYPRLRLFWVVEDRCAAVLEAHPLLEEVIVFPRQKIKACWAGGRYREAWEEIRRLRRKLAGLEIQLSLDLQGLAKSGLMVLMARARQRLGCTGLKEFSYLLSRPVPEGEGLHAVARNLKVAEYLGCPAGPPEYTLGLRAEDWFTAAREAHSSGDAENFRKLVHEGLALLLQADQLLESHSLLRLRAWLDHARGHQGSAAEKDDWERNARHIITTWGPPVNDYACRVWSGLIRDFYVPRLKAVTDAMADGKPFDRREWEARWVNGLGISPCKPLPAPAVQAAAWVKAAYERQIPQSSAQGEVIGTWEPGLVTGDWKSVEWKITPEQLTRLDGVRFLYTKGSHRLDIREASIVADGKVIATDRHDGETGDVHRANVYRFKLPGTVNANNTLVLRAEIRSLAGANSYGQVLLFGKK